MHCGEKKVLEHKVLAENGNPGEKVCIHFPLILQCAWGLNLHHDCSRHGARLCQKLDAIEEKWEENTYMRKLVHFKPHCLSLNCEQFAIVSSFMKYSRKIDDVQFE